MCSVICAREISLSLTVFFFSAFVFPECLIYPADVCDPVWCDPPSYLWAELLGLPPHALWHFSAACGQVEDGCGRHVSGLHVMTVVEAAFAAGAAGTAAPTPSASGTPCSSSTAQTAVAAAAVTGGICAGGTAGWTRVLAVTLGCKT